MPHPLERYKKELVITRANCSQLREILMSNYHDIPASIDLLSEDYKHLLSLIHEMLCHEISTWRRRCFLEREDFFNKRSKHEPLSFELTSESKEQFIKHLISNWPSFSKYLDMSINDFLSTSYYESELAMFKFFLTIHPDINRINEVTGQPFLARHERTIPVIFENACFFHSRGSCFTA
jgi:hypothetical protein